MNLLLELDRYLFLTLNHLPHTSTTDTLALILSGVGTYGLVWGILVFWIFIREEQKDRLFFLQFISVAVSSLVAVEILLKPSVGRLRPYAELVTVVVGRVSDGFSFPSGHATFAFAAAVVLARKEPQYARWFYILAIAISFTRIYLGQHYPLDVIAGSILGGTIGFLAIAGSNSMRTYLHRKTKRSPSS